VELEAEKFLQKKGLRKVTRNYLIKGGEIDLIMRDGEVLVFIEVRYRQSDDHGSGAETVTYQKQRRLRRAALHYLQKHYGNHEPDCRFDVISASGNPVVFEWISDAF
jgi:putative endonuclease